MNDVNSLKLSQKTFGILISIMTISTLFPFYIGLSVFLIIGVFLIGIHLNRLPHILSEQYWLIIFALFSGGVSYFSHNTLGIVMMGIFILYILVFSIIKTALSERIYTTQLHLLTFGSVVVGFWNLWRYIVFIRQHQFPITYVITSHDPIWRGEATFFNANYYGMFCIFIILIVMYLYPRYASSYAKFFYIVCISINVISLVLTASRMVYPVLCFVMGVYLFFTYKKALLYYVTAFLVLLILVAFFPKVLPRYSSLLYSFQDRIVLWQGGVNIFASRPLTGRGSLSYLQFYYLFEGKPQMHSHNLLIDILANYGLIGLFMLCQPLIDYARHLFTHSSKTLIGLIASFFATVIIHGITDVSIMWVQTAYVFLLIIMGHRDHKYT